MPISSIKNSISSYEVHRKPLIKAVLTPIALFALSSICMKRLQKHTKRTILPLKGNLPVNLAYIATSSTTVAPSFFYFRPITKKPEDPPKPPEQPQLNQVFDQWNALPNDVKHNIINNHLGIHDLCSLGLTSRYYQDQVNQNTPDKPWKIRVLLAQAKKLLPIYNEKKKNEIAFYWDCSSDLEPWVNIDNAIALAEAQLDLPVVQAEMMLKIVQVAAKTDLNRAYELVPTIKTKCTKNKAYLHLLKVIAPHNTALAEEIFKKISENRAQANYFLIKGLAKRDIDKAQKIVLGWQNCCSPISELKVSIDLLFGRDPLTTPLFTEKAFIFITQTLLENEPEKAQIFKDSITNDLLKRLVSFEIEKRKEQPDFKPLKTNTLNLYHRDSLFTKIALYEAQSGNYDAAEETLGLLPPGDVRDNVHVKIIAERAKTDPHKAIEKVKTLITEEYQQFHAMKKICVAVVKNHCQLLDGELKEFLKPGHIDNVITEMILHDKIDEAKSLIDKNKDEIISNPPNVPILFNPLQAILNAIKIIAKTDEAKAKKIIRTFLDQPWEQAVALLHIAKAVADKI